MFYKLSILFELCSIAEHSIQLDWFKQENDSSA